MSLATRPLAPTVPNDLEAFFVPFTPNRAFKKNPRLIARAKDMHYITLDGRKVMDGSAGMWCCNAGHNRDPIVAAIQQQAAELDYPPAFQFSHPKAFELASRIAALAPGDLDAIRKGITTNINPVTAGPDLASSGIVKRSLDDFILNPPPGAVLPGKEAEAAQAAADQALTVLGRVKGRGGLITLDRTGRIGIAWNTPAMAFALRPPGDTEYRAGP
jgi:hypothetical protein